MWNQISIVYHRASGRLNFYHLNSQEHLTFKTLVTYSNMFTAGSKIAIGQWIPGARVVLTTPPGFQGKIDEVRIWNRQLSGADIKSSSKVNVQYSAEHLAVLWKFNEGKGVLVKDIKSHVHLYIQEVHHRVEWVYGMAIVTVLPIVTPVIKSEMIEWCTGHILNSPISHICRGLGNPSTTVYYRACLETTSASGDIIAGVSVVVAYSDYCHVSLGLVTWPARILCNYPAFLSSPHIPWSGTSCQQSCYFGTRTADRCSCLPGFYDSSCSSVCPGGITTRCYGNGACSQTTGRCACNYNWYGSSCNRCRPGYYGTDCSLNIGGLVPSGRKTSISVSGNGHFIGMSKAAWVYRGTGEFKAIISKRLGVSVQFRQVSSGTGVRLRCAVVQTVTGILAIHSGVETGVTITLNGKHIDYNKRILLGSGFVYNKLSHNKMEISGPEGFSMTLYYRQISFSVQVTMDKSFCQDSCGLFGNCGNSSNLNCTSTGLLQRFDKSKIRQRDIDEFMTTWSVPRNESQFRDVLAIAKETNITTAAGTCLYFSNNALITPSFVNLFHGNFVTIQFYLKLKDLHTPGTIFSFVLNTSLAFRLNGTLKIHFGVKIFDTNILPELGKWNHITFVYHRDVGVLELYVRNSMAIFVTRVITIGVGAFEPGGKLALGLWQASTKVIPFPGGFVGWIDEIVLWNKRFDVALIKNYVGVSIVHRINGIVALWKFNEGTGSLARDLVGSLHFNLPRPPWSSPKWVPSDIYIAVQTEVTSGLTQADNKTKSLCEKIFSSKSLNDSCGQMEERKDFSYQACLQDLQTSGFIDAGKDSVMAYARECQIARNLTNLPGNDLCDVFTDERYDDWSGTACDIICIFGTIDNITCRCDEGYWGVTCAKECPGGASNPCNKRGKCDDITGVCICDQKWRGDASCNSCTPGWMGSACAIAVPKPFQPTSSVTVTATAGSGGIIIAGDGTIFRLNSVGEFTLLKGKDIDAQVRQVPCRNGKSLCFNAVGISVDSTSISIHAPYENGEDVVININGTVMDKNDIGQATQVGVNITFLGPDELLVRNGDNLGIRVNINGQHMSLETTTSKTLNNKLGGLLGSTSSNATSSSNTSVPSLRRLLNATDIDEATRKVFGVSQSSSRIIILDKSRHETVTVYGGGYCLFFKFTAIFSKPIVHLFIEDVITFEIMVNMNCGPLICGGPILSYTSYEMIYISTYSTLRVIIGTRVYDTGMEVEINNWNQVTMTFWSLRLEMTICLTLSQGTLLCKSFQVVANPFSAGGTIAIGAWQPSSDGRPGLVPTTTFVGEIDEFRTWSRAFDYALLQQHWLANLTPDVDGLTGLWKFNEGLGNVVNDLVGINHLYFPGEPWNKPVWYYSDLPIPYMGISRSDIDNNIINQLANTTCSELFRSGPLLNYCSRLPSLINRQYFDMCYESVTDTGQNSSSLESVLLFSDYCMKTLSLRFWPAQSLCNKFPGEVFPKWIGRNCDVPCVFGLKDNDNPEKCKCNFGYWGVACDQTCPGGSKSPCTNHGTCDTISGKCTCEIQWTGTDDCSSCSSEWTGSDCSLAVSKVTVIGSDIRFSGMFGLSLFTTLDGHSFTLGIIGEYYLFYSVHVHFSIQVRLVYCYGTSSCVNSIAFRTAQHTLVLHGPYTTDRYPVVWLDGSVIDLDLQHVKISEYGFVFRKQSISVYVFEYSTFKISIRVQGRFLSLISKVSGVICDSSYGILGSCNNPFPASLDPGFSLSNCTNKNGTSVSETLTKNVYEIKNVTTKIIRKLVQKLKVQACDSLFVYHYGSYQEYRDSNAGYALHFHHTAIVSGLIHQPFEYEDITLEFYIKLSSTGVIFSYTKLKTFVLTAGSTHFTIYFGEKKFDSKIAVQLKHWNQIILVFKKLTSVLQLYHFDYRGQLTRQDLVIGEDIFQPGGVLAIGAWQPSVDGSGPQLYGYFKGYIDEFKIWTMAYHPAVVSQAWLREVGVSTKNLARLWKLDEGEGFIVKEDQTKSILSLETSPWQSPSWVYSQLELKPPLPGTASTGLPVNKTFEAMAKSFCNEIILQGPLHSSCNSLGPAVSTYYFKACVSVVVTTEDVEASLDIVIAYSDYCQSILGLSTWPARVLCNKFSTKEFPIWYGSQCDKK